MARKKASKAADSPPFEEALDELQQIVGDLEEGSLGLEDSLARFEKGVALLRTCYRVLEEAEKKIEILTGVDADGNPTTEPFDATATIDQSSASAGRRSQSASSETDDDSESTLF